MKLYTKTGDHLKTDTLQKRTFKNDLIVEVSGSIDELQAQIMVASNFIKSPAIKAILLTICETLFTVSYDLGSLQATLSNDKVTEIESWIDDFDKKLNPLTEFIIPGKTKAGSFMHLARTSARRAERIIVTYALDNKINDAVLKYMNRISDLFFVLARTIDEITE